MSIFPFGIKFEGCGLQPGLHHPGMTFDQSAIYSGIEILARITFFLFGVAVVMLAGSGSIFEEQFGIPSMIGNIIMAILAIFTVTLNVQKLISVIGLVTPFLLLMEDSLNKGLPSDRLKVEIRGMTDNEKEFTNCWRLYSFKR